MKRFPLVFSFFALWFTGLAQHNWVKQWDRRFGGTKDEWLFSFQQTTDGGYILGGFSYSDSSGDKTQANWDSSHLTRDFWVIKIGEFGSKQWDKRFGGTENDVLSSLYQTNDGGYILGGTSNSGISGDKTQPNWGTSDYWIVKIDSLGNKQWDKRFGGNVGGQLTAVHQTTDGGYILGGYTASDATGDISEPNKGYSMDADYWIVKTDPLGNKQWDKRFGGNWDDQLHDLYQTKDGGYILGGYTRSDNTGDVSQPSRSSGKYDYWIVKTNALGIRQWDKRFGARDEDHLYSVQQTTDKGYILGGWTWSDSSSDMSGPLRGTYPDFWIIKTDSSGTKQWDKRIGGGTNESAFGYVKQTPDGGYLLSGVSSSHIGYEKTEENLGGSQSWIIKIDALGIKQWDKTIFTLGSDFAGYAIQTQDGCYAVANFTLAGVGGYKSQPTRGSSDFWIVKLCDTVYCNNTVSVGVNGNVITAFNAGSYQWYLNDTVINGANSSSYIATQTGDYRVEITDTSGCQSFSNPLHIIVSGIPESAITTRQFEISPNPASTSVTISTDEPLPGSTLTVYDITGRVITHCKLQMANTQLSVAGFGSGVYFVSIENEKGRSTRKLVVEK